MTKKEFAIAANKFKQVEDSKIHAVATDEVAVDLVADIMNELIHIKATKRLDSTTIKVGEDYYRFFNVTTAPVITGCCLMFYNDYKQKIQSFDDYLNDLVRGEV